MAMTTFDKKIMEWKILDKIKGCMIGGAAGDALGYAIEFDDENEIFGKFGEQGITSYQLDPYTGKALISDDTQMSMFTATGICYAQTRGSLRGVGAAPSRYMGNAYLDWLLTQESSKARVMRDEKAGKQRNSYAHVSWLLNLEEMYEQRAPGLTCLSSMRSYKYKEDYLEKPVNKSKGCGGIMRVAPVGLMSHLYGGWRDRQLVDQEAAQIAAITHGHSLGYMPAAVLAHVINRIVFPDMDQKISLKEIILDAKEAVDVMFQGDKHLKELDDLIDLAVKLAENTGAESDSAESISMGNADAESANVGKASVGKADADLENIHKLGAGWVAEETLAIALYCALKYQDDFSAGIIAAVNHEGDSDSTGAVTGNILGAWLGYRKIEDKWKENLELADTILELSEDLFYGCPVTDPYDDKESKEDAYWLEKYNYVFPMRK